MGNCGGFGLVIRFNGVFEYSIDAKGRINIPAKFRKSLATSGSETLYIRKMPNKSLGIYPVDVWEKEAEKLASLPTTPQNMKYQRTVYRSLTDSTIDAQGRITITPAQLSYVGVAKKATLVGMGNYIELVSPDALLDEDDDFDDAFYTAEADATNE